MKIVRNGRQIETHHIQEESVVPAIIKRKPRATIVVSEIKTTGSLTVIHPLVKLSGGLTEAVHILKTLPRFCLDKKYMAWSSIDGFHKYDPSGFFIPTEWRILKG